MRSNRARCTKSDGSGRCFCFGVRLGLWTEVQNNMTYEQLLARGKALAPKALYSSLVFETPENYASLCLFEADGVLGMAMARIELQVQTFRPPDRNDSVRRSALELLASLDPKLDESGERCVIFMRHGFPEGIDKDSGLGKEGKAQITRSADELHRLFPDGVRAIFTTMRRRAIQSAEIVHQRVGSRASIVSISPYTFAESEFETSWALSFWCVRGPLLLVGHEPQIVAMTKAIPYRGFDQNKGGVWLSEVEFVIISTNADPVYFRS